MKKLFLSFIVITVFLSGCDKETYMDGNYSAEYDQFDSHGWKAYIDIAIVDDVIADVKYDYVNLDGESKFADDAYQERMVSFGGFDIGPQDYIPSIESQIANASIEPEFEGIDGVAGATSSTANATELVMAALGAAKDGLTDTTILVTQPDPLAYVDGTYEAEYDQIDSHGWQAFIEIDIAGNTVTSANFDYRSAEGILKSEDDDYQALMSGIVGIGPQDFIPTLESQVEAATVFPQFGEIDGVTGATSSSGDIVTLLKAALDAALEGDTEVVSLEQPDPPETTK